jgi:hypothetical protein
VVSESKSESDEVFLFPGTLAGGTDASLGVIELCQISGPRRQRWTQRLALLTALGAVAAGAWIAFSWENRHVSYHRRANVALSPVAGIPFEPTAIEPPATVDAAVQIEGVRDSGTIVDSPSVDSPIYDYE